MVVSIAAHQRHAHCEIAGEFVHTAAKDVALVHDRCHHAGERPEEVRRVHDHSGQAWVHGQPQHRPSRRGDRPRSIERAEVGEQRPCRLHRLGRRRVEKGQRFGRRLPRSQLQHEAGKIHLGDLGRQVCQSGLLFELAPEAVGDAGLGSPGSAGALVGRGAAGDHGGEAGHARPHVEARHPRQPRIHHHAHSRHGERRLGDVGAEHYTAPSGGRGCERSVLVEERQCARQRVDVDVWRHPVGQHRLDPADLADAGEEHEDVALVVTERREYRVRHGLLDPHVLAGW